MAAQRMRDSIGQRMRDSIGQTQNQSNCVKSCSRMCQFVCGKACTLEYVLALTTGPIVVLWFQEMGETWGQ